MNNSYLGFSFHSYMLTLTWKLLFTGRSFPLLARVFLHMQFHDCLNVCVFHKLRARNRFSTAPSPSDQNAASITIQSSWKEMPDPPHQISLIIATELSVCYSTVLTLSRPLQVPSEYTMYRCRSLKPDERYYSNWDELSDKFASSLDEDPESLSPELIAYISAVGYLTQDKMQAGSWRTCWLQMLGG